ncbi:MAG: DUF1294 domain-containing protein [Candidatus Kerfeldbacteria bacterium]
MEFSLINILLVYVIAINVITFIVYGFDKWMARAGSWRVSEAVLWILALIGGSAGALSGMNFFRHKTRKVWFQFVLMMILFIQIGALFLLYYFEII